MRERLDYWAGEFPNLQTRADILHHCQVPEGAIQTMEDLINIRSVTVPHDFGSIDTWEQRTDLIGDEMSVDQAFVAFADIEDDFEELERQVIRMSNEMDRAVQDEIDFLRGK
jgi:L-lysine 2,3-aminomutase